MRRPGSAGMRRVRRREDISTPRGSGMGLGAHYDPEAFGRLSEAIARYFGTARFLGIQSVIVAIWIALNSVGFISHWDPYPFILLNLLFSTQAAYAAPLILLAQNRQDARDRETTERDRLVAARTQADTEYLARELVSLRLSLAGMATADELNGSLAKLEALLGHIGDRVEHVAASTAAGNGGAATMGGGEGTAAGQQP